MKELPLIDTRSDRDPCCGGFEGEVSDCCAGPAARPPLTEPSTAYSRNSMRISGMDCASCALTLERSVAQVDGVECAVVNFAASRMDVYHQPPATPAMIEQAVRRAGFDVVHARAVAPASPWRLLRARLTLVSAMLFALGLTALALDAAPDWLATALLASAIVVGGAPIFRAAVTGLRARHMDMNVLMSAATLGAAIIGEWAEAASIVVLFSIGNALQVYAIERTRGAVQALAELTPDTVLVERGTAQIEVQVDDVEVGDRVLVHPGERLAVDGHIVEGATTVDESPITGESATVDKSTGDAVLSGSLNGAGSVVVAVDRTAEHSTLQKTTRLVENAQASTAPTEQFVDRFSRTYTPLVVAAAVALAIVPPLAGADAATWLYRGLALLIIACPCSLVISTPVTVVSGIGAASRRGILIKGGAALEAAGRITAIAFDKTGTLTEGRPQLASSTALGDTTEESALRLAGALERRSEHPLAHAILTAASKLELPPVTDFASIPGRGARGRIEAREYLIGSPRLFIDEGIDLTDVAPVLKRLAAAGETPIILGDHVRALAVFGVADSTRPEARRVLTQLQQVGIEHLVMLTGDSDGAARRVATELHIEYRSNLLPDQKVDALRELIDQHGRVGMVGDGINDAPALATASVSFAMGAAGSDVALQTADIALMQDDLDSLTRSVRLSRAAERIIRQNVAVSLLVKGTFVLAAPFGLVTLWMAVAADMGTSIAVTLNGLRLFRHGR